MKVLENISLQEVASSFDENGYPLFMEERIKPSIDVEEAIISALFSKTPRLYEGIPILLIKNSINYKKLKRLIDQSEFWNEFGYFGEFILRHFKNRDLERLVNYCRKHLKPSSILYPYDIEYSRKYQKAEEKKWNLLGAPGYNELQHQFEVYTT
jgi:hypothetical protein